MSYLGPLRLHFFGKFQAAPSTVNNDPVHYDITTFQPNYQKLQTKSAPNGWWNPMGDASWRLIDCSVTGAYMANGEAAAPTDEVLALLVTDSDAQVSAKIVDLDPEQQLVSEVWGLQVRLVRRDGTTLLKGTFATAPFSDIWDRSGNAGGDIGAGAFYQSVLTDLIWGDISDSLFLHALEESARDGLLSIKFNVDGYNMSHGTPDFTRGRIAGTIGPASPAEPRHFVLGRQFMAKAGPNPNFFAPAGRINSFPAALDSGVGKLYLDLGNALPSTSPGGPMDNLGSLQLACLSTDQQNHPVQTLLGSIDYHTHPEWYKKTAGVVAMPADRALTKDELKLIENNPLGLTTSAPGTSGPQLAISEPASGLYLRADQIVFRMNPGDHQDVTLYATMWGKPYPSARVISFFDGSQLQAQSVIGQPPPLITPLSAVDFPSRVVTDARGIGTLPIAASNPGIPRSYIDGQVYGIRAVLEDTLAFGSEYPENQWDFISILLWSDFQIGSPATWFGGIRPILQQYANLYPIMSRFLNLGDYDSVCTNRVPLLQVFGLPLTDPNSMPVTRDLSHAKRDAILRWLRNLGKDGKPLLGEPKSTPAALTKTVLGCEDDVMTVIARGGKSAAAAKRRMLQPPATRLAQSLGGKA